MQQNKSFLLFNIELEWTRTQKFNFHLLMVTYSMGFGFYHSPCEYNIHRIGFFIMNGIWIHGKLIER